MNQKSPTAANRRLRSYGSSSASLRERANAATALTVGRRERLRQCLLVLLSFVVVLFVFDTLTLHSQDNGDVPINADEIASVMNDTPPEVDPSGSEATEPSHIDLLSLITRGGTFMIPIGLMSLLVVALATERIISLREEKIIPPSLIEELRGLATPSDSFNPSLAYHACEDYPSPAASVIQGMLLRTGQTIGSIEQSATETAQREADQQASPIRWLNLAAAATPLMGLLGTVWGMIVAFHESTTLTQDRSRSEQLSEGIYTALVTTLAGLLVAIPAAILAQYLENRLAKLFHRIEALAFELAPVLAQFTGNRRLDAEGLMRSMSSGTRSSVDAKPEPPPPAPPPVANKKQRKESKAT